MKLTHADEEADSCFSGMRQATSNQSYVGGKGVKIPKTIPVTLEVFFHSDAAVPDELKVGDAGDNLFLRSNWFSNIKG